MSGLAEALRGLLAAPERCDCGPQGCGTEGCRLDAYVAARVAARAALAAHDAAVSAGGCVADGALVWCNGHVLATAHGLTLAPYRAARIVACVNACTGIADPAALVAAARDALALADERERSLGCLSEEYAKVQSSLREALDGAA